MGKRRRALVTGGAKRVGRAIALALAEAGYELAITYLSSEREAKQTAKLIAKRGGKCELIQADLTDPAGAERIGQTIGDLHVLVNNASMYEPGDLREAGPDQWRKLTALHTQTPLALCRVFETRLRSSGGHVVNMLDLLAERPWPKYLVHCATKAALWNLTLSLARELAPEVTVNGIAPGVVEWPAGYPESEKEKYLRRVPLARAGTPEDVAKAVVFFCTQGSYVTGQVLRLDGGRSLT